jgi:RNA polymerase sigma-70 factor (ECF subfamily)
MAGPERGQLVKLVGSPRDGQPDALAELAQSVVRGDRRALRTFLVTVSPHLLRVSRKVLGVDHPDVDDVAQESAYAVIEALPQHRGECSILHFACRIAVLTAMNLRRREATKKRASIRDAGYEIEQLPATSNTPDLEAAAQARARVIRDLMDTLPEEQADVLAMHCVLGYTMREIAETSQTPLETVRSRFRLAKQAMRKRIADDPNLVSLAEDA